jgi:hypothetical protein
MQRVVSKKLRFVYRLKEMAPKRLLLLLFSPLSGFSSRHSEGVYSSAREDSKKP